MKFIKYLKKSKKAISLGLCTAMLTVSMPFNIFADDSVSKINSNLTVTELRTVDPNGEISSLAKELATTEKIDVPVLMGFKKTVVVNALKYGGTVLAKIVDSIGDKAVANLLKKNAFAIGDFLDHITNSIEARLIDFMIFELGLPSSAARTIAWTITTFLI